MSVQALHVRLHNRLPDTEINRRRRLRRINPRRFIRSLKIRATNNDRKTQHGRQDDQCSVDHFLHGYAAKSLMDVST